MSLLSAPVLRSAETLARGAVRLAGLCVLLAAFAAGRCRTHYARHRENRLLAEGRFCAVDGCGGPASHTRYCQRHYERVRQHGDPGPAYRLTNPQGENCQADGCESPPVARRYCSAHYEALCQQKTCSVGGCDQPLVALALCRAHYSAHRRGHGHAERAIDRRCGCDLCRRYRQDNPDEWDRAQHTRHERERRRRRRVEAFTLTQRRLIVRRLRDGATPAEAAGDAGIPVRALWEYAVLIPRWGRAVDELLRQTRDPAITHGTEYAYKEKHCRCADCREWNRSRGEGDRARKLDLIHRESGPQGITVLNIASDREILAEIERLRVEVAALRQPEDAPDRGWLEIDELILGRTNKIQALAKIRELCGCGLREAVDLLDERHQTLRHLRPNGFAEDPDEQERDPLLLLSPDSQQVDNTNSDNRLA